MSGRSIAKYILACDGCGSERPEAATSTEARASAYADGWRFPATLTGRNRPGTGASDVCPDCIGGWEPRQRARP